MTLGAAFPTPLTPVEDLSPVICISPLTHGPNLGASLTGSDTG